MEQHNLNDLRTYQTYHFPIFKGQKELIVQSNVEIQEQDAIKVGKDLYKVTKVVKVKDTVTEFTGHYADAAQTKWVNPIKNYSEQTKYYVLEVERWN